MNHTLTLRRNLISLAIFNSIFFKIGGGLLFFGQYVRDLLCNAINNACPQSICVRYGKWCKR